MRESRELCFPDGSAEIFPVAFGARTAVLLGHGAGGDRRAPLLRGLASRLAGAGFPAALYNFPYREAGRKAPDRAPLLERAALTAAEALRRPLAAPSEPLAAPPSLVLGGKSMGGRIAAQVVAGSLAPGLDVRGLLFLGFPLHAAGREHDWERRAATLSALRLPLLFLQGSRDRLCRLDLLERAIAGLDARLHVVAGADHSLALPARSGRLAEAVLDELAEVATAWLTDVGERS